MKKNNQNFYGHQREFSLLDVTFKKFVERHNDSIYFEKMGEHLSQKQICALQQDLLIAQESTEKLNICFESSKTKVTDNLAYVQQKVKATSKSSTPQYADVSHTNSIDEASPHNTTKDPQANI